MREFIFCTIFWCAVSGTRVPSLAAQQDLLTRLQEEINKDSYMSAIISTTEPPQTTPNELTLTSSTSSTANKDSSSVAPIKLSATPLLESHSGDVISELSTLSPPPLSMGEAEPPNRRYVTYDQRQEGQYNIRADLENFMIVLIPPNPVEGINLLDVLTKSSYRRSHHNASKNKRKQSSNLQLSPQMSGIRQSLKGGSGQNFNYIARTPSSSSTALLAKQAPVAIVEGVSGSSGSSHWPEFIEGRTPYHVDISAAESENSRIHPDRQVDVLPPPYPLAYQHLIKPFHLDAEPTVIQALPPPEVEAARMPASFLESYNQLLTSGLQTAAAADSSSRARHNNDGSEMGYYRISRSIHDDNPIESNKLNSAPTTQNRFSFFRQHFLDRYPPIDVPDDFLKPRSRIRPSEKYRDDLELHDQALDDGIHLTRIIVPPIKKFPEDDVEQDLHNIRLLDLETMSLLSDGLERCAPGYRRNSYGMCREIEGY